MTPDNPQFIISFLLLSNGYKLVLTLILLYFAIKFKDPILGLIILLSGISIYFNVTDHRDWAEFLAVPLATLLCYKLVISAKHRLEVKHPTDNPPSILPDALHSDYNKNETKRERREDSGEGQYLSGKDQ